MMRPRALALLFLLVAIAFCPTAHTQRAAFTPGGLRLIEKNSDYGIGNYHGGSAASGLAASGAGRGGGSQQTAADNPPAVSASLDPSSGSLLFQSIPNFPEAELEALNTFTSILRSRSSQPEADSSSNRQGGTHARSAADEFIEALLKTTRASLARSNPGLLPMQSWGHGHIPGDDSTAAEQVQQADTSDSSSREATVSTASTDSSRSADASDSILTLSTPEGDDDDDADEIEAAGNSQPQDADDHASTAADVVLQDTSMQAQQSLSTDMLSAAAAAMDPAERPSSTQQIADTASAVEGQVLVTQAELIPAMQGTYGQVVLTSLKMRPMPALELLSKVSGSPADAPAAVKAAAWQDNLKLALEAAAALEANASVTQMHTRMTSILNMGLELAEPPLEFASAAASSVAGSIKALTGDESVLVGVSLVRLGAHSHAHDNTAGQPGSQGSAPVPAPAAASLNSRAPAGVQSAGIHASAAAPKSSMLAMLTLYGVGAPTNAVQIAQRMKETCPELFVFGASLANSVCGRNIISNYVAAVLAAEKAGRQVSATEDAAALIPSQPSRALLQQAGGVSFSSRLTATHSGGAHTFAATATLSTSSSGARVDSDSKQADGSRSSTSSTTSSSSSSKGLPAATATDAGDANVAVARKAEQHTPEIAAFIDHSDACLRVRQQPEVNIIITQAIGVAPGQQPALLAEKLQQLAQAPALAEILTLSGLTLAQSSKPQIINLSAAAAAGFGGNAALAAATEAAAAGLGGPARGSSSDSSSISAGKGGSEGGGAAVATPAVIGVAVAVAVSVVAVCVAAVVIVVVKQRAKQARAAAAADDQLPKSSKRRRSTKGKGTTSKYLPTSHPALSHPGAPGLPPSPCVVITAINSPSCQHTPSHSPVKPCNPLSLRPPPLASAGSSALLSLGSGAVGSLPAPLGGASVTPGPAGLGTPSGVAGLFLGPAVTRGDSVSSAVMAEFAEQRQQLVAQHGGEGTEVGSEGEDDEQQQPQQQQQRMLFPVRGTASLGSPGSSSSSSSGTSQQQPLPSCSSPFHHIRQQWQQREACSRSNSPTCTPCALPGCAHDLRAGHPALGDHGVESSTAVSGEAAAAPAAAEALRLFSRPVSESSLPDELKVHLAAAAAATAGQTTTSSSNISSAVPATPGNAGSHGNGLPTLRTLTSVSSGPNPDRLGAAGLCSSSGRYSSGCAARASPFMAYDVGVLLGAASSPLAAAAAAAVGVASSPLAAAAAAAAAAVTSSVADSSMQLPQWASSLASSSVSLAAARDGNGLVPAGSSCVSDGTSTFGAQEKAGRQHAALAPSSLGSQARASPKASVRATPFMNPFNVPRLG